VAPEFNSQPDPQGRSDAVLRPLEGRPYILHVGSAVSRKRLDVLFEVFARLRADHPDLRLVQQGAELSSAQQAHIDRLGIGDALVQPQKLDRTALATLYRGASAVLLTSEAEGFGFPVIEAMACGAAVVASDLPALREVGGNAALYAPVGDVPAWTAKVHALLEDASAAPTRAARLERAREFTWREHARTLRDAYENLVTPRADRWRAEHSQ